MVETPFGTTTLYEYDVNGSRTSVKYANGIVAAYEYDKLNRLISESAIDKKVAHMVEYTYTLGAAGERFKARETGRTIEYKDTAIYYTNEVYYDQFFCSAK